MSASTATRTNLKDIAMAAKAAATSASAATTSTSTSVPNGHSKTPKLSAEEIERRRERQKALLESLADELVELTDIKTREAAEKGHGYTKVAEYFLPGFNKFEQKSPEHADQTETVMVPRNPPETTHWAGRGVDPSKDGLPIVMLLQGVREQTPSGPQLRPDLLPGGKTAWQIAQSKLEAQDSEVRLDCSFNSKQKSLIITAIWIEDDWQRFQSRRQTRRPPFHGQPGGGPGRNQAPPPGADWARRAPRPVPKTDN